MEQFENFFNGKPEKPTIEESFGIWAFIISIFATMNYSIAFVSGMFAMLFGMIIKKWIIRKKKN